MLVALSSGILSLVLVLVSQGATRLFHFPMRLRFSGFGDGRARSTEARMRLPG